MEEAVGAQGKNPPTQIPSPLRLRLHCRLRPSIGPLHIQRHHPLTAATTTGHLHHVIRRRRQLSGIELPCPAPPRRLVIGSGWGGQ